VEKLKEANMCGLSKQFIVHGVREKQKLKIHLNSTLLNSLPSFCNLQNGYENLRNQCHTFGDYRNDEEFPIEQLSAETDVLENV